MAFLFFCETLQMWRHVVLVLLWIAGHSVHVPSWQEIVPVAPRSDAVELPAEGTWFHDSADLAAGQDLNLAEMSANVADNMRTPRGWRMRKKRKKKRRRELINEIVKSGKPVSPKEQARLQTSSVEEAVADSNKALKYASEDIVDLIADSKKKHELSSQLEQAKTAVKAAGTPREAQETIVPALRKAEKELKALGAAGAKQFKKLNKMTNDVDEAFTDVLKIEAAPTAGPCKKGQKFTTKSSVQSSQKFAAKSSVQSSQKFAAKSSVQSSQKFAAKSSVQSSQKSTKAGAQVTAGGALATAGPTLAPTPRRIFIPETGTKPPVSWPTAAPTIPPTELPRLPPPCRRPPACSTLLHEMAQESASQQQASFNLKQAVVAKSVAETPAEKAAADKQLKLAKDYMKVAQKTAAKAKAMAAGIKETPTPKVKPVVHVARAAKDIMKRLKAETEVFKEVERLGEKLLAFKAGNASAGRLKDAQEELTQAEATFAEMQKRLKKRISEDSRDGAIDKFQKAFLMSAVTNQATPCPSPPAKGKGKGSLVEHHVGDGTTTGKPTGKPAAALANGKPTGKPAAKLAKGPAPAQLGGTTTAGPAPAQLGGTTTAGPTQAKLGGTTTAGPAQAKLGGTTTAGATVATATAGAQAAKLEAAATAGATVAKLDATTTAGATIAVIGAATTPGATVANVGAATTPGAVEAKLGATTTAGTVETNLAAAKTTGAPQLLLATTAETTGEPIGETHGQPTDEALVKPGATARRVNHGALHQHHHHHEAGGEQDGKPHGKPAPGGHKMTPHGKPAKGGHGMKPHGKPATGGHKMKPHGKPAAGEPTKKPPPERAKGEPSKKPPPEQARGKGKGRRLWPCAPPCAVGYPVWHHWYPPHPCPGIPHPCPGGRPYMYHGPVPFGAPPPYAYHRKAPSVDAGTDTSANPDTDLAADEGTGSKTDTDYGQGGEMAGEAKNGGNPMPRGVLHEHEHTSTNDHEGGDTSVSASDSKSANASNSSAYAASDFLVPPKGLKGGDTSVSASDSKSANASNSSGDAAPDFLVPAKNLKGVTKDFIFGSAHGLVDPTRSQEGIGSNTDYGEGPHGGLHEHEAAAGGSTTSKPAAESAKGKPTGKPAAKSAKGKPTGKPAAKSAKGKPTGKPAAKSGKGRSAKKPAGKLAKGKPSSKPGAKSVKGKPTGKPVAKSAKGKPTGKPAAKSAKGPEHDLKKHLKDQAQAHAKAMDAKDEEIDNLKKELEEEKLESAKLRGMPKKKPTKKLTTKPGLAKNKKLVKGKKKTKAGDESEFRDPCLEAAKKKNAKKKKAVPKLGLADFMPGPKKKKKKVSEKEKNANGGNGKRGERAIKKKSRIKLPANRNVPCTNGSSGSSKDGNPCKGTALQSGNESSGHPANESAGLAANASGGDYSADPTADGSGESTGSGSAASDADDGWLKAARGDYSASMDASSTVESKDDNVTDVGTGEYPVDEVDDDDDWLLDTKGDYDADPEAEDWLEDA
eukprot:TRINITY_DN3658_c0_g1_i1.p1 TRINITY_DN3658_c0_g1~~TRINITY_DN3658_c0_g1_i1.p1  ORF type:complete len:1490 (-),score=353.54 TRINITY_DN3658_c0_g1_i1:92-4561(-)